MNFFVNFSKNLRKCSICQPFYLVRAFAAINKDSAYSQSQNVSDPQKKSLINILESYQQSILTPQHNQFPDLDQNLNTYDIKDITSASQMAHLLTILKKTSTSIYIPQRFFKAIDEWLLNYLNSFKISELNALIEVLQLYLESDQKNPGLIKSMQILVFHHIDQISLKSIQVLYELHQSQGVLDRQDMTEIVIEPYIDQISSRFSSLDLLEASEILLNYTQNRKSYGIYTDSKLQEIAVNCMQKLGKTPIKDQRFVQVYINLLEFFYITRNLDQKIAVQAIKDIKSIHTSLKPEYILKFGAYFSPFGIETEIFWNSYTKNLDEVSKLALNSFQQLFCLTMANLRISHPRLQTKIYRRLSEELQDTILNQKPSPLNKSEASEDRKLLINILKHKKINFMLDLNEGVNIDIAVPSKHIAYKLLEPKDYLWPEGKPNGIVSSESFILSKRHWRVKTISAFNFTTELARKAYLKSIVIEDD